MTGMTKAKSKAQIKSENTRSDVIAGGKAARKGQNGISKKSVTFHKSTTNAEGVYKDTSDVQTFDSTVGTPNPEQLAKINEFTRSPKTADQLVVFSTLSANTMPDRDDDYFDKATIDGFAALPAPYGPTGKSYMVGHDYNQLPQGRIFGTGTQDAMDTHFLTNEVYIPNTAKNAGFIEDIDFGINWAVSVGVLLEAQLCSICEENQYSFFGMAFCESGHWKGEMYDPAETRTDDWGDVIPAREGDAKAVKCLGVMHGAKDFYELSQVFLGAQFNAAIASPSGDKDKVASLKRMKSAVKGGVFLSPGVPLLNLSAAEAQALPLPTSDPKVAEALVNYDVQREDDGSMKWVDSEDLMWFYTPGDSVTCLGKSAQGDDEQEDADGEGTPDEPLPADEGEASGAGEGGDGSELEESERGGAGDEPDDEVDPGADDGDPDELGSGGDLSDTAQGDDATQEGVDSAMSKAAVLAAAKRAKCPPRLLSAINEAADDSALEAVLRAASSSITELSAQVSDMSPKAAMGERFIKSKRADALDAFVKSHVGAQEGVDTKKLERMLDSFGDNVDLIEDITEQYRTVLRAKLPAAVRRSSDTPDPNVRQEPNHGARPSEAAPTLSTRGARTVSRIHG